MRDYLRVKLVAEPNEIFAAVFLDSMHQVLAYEPLFRGTINSTSVYPRVVVQRVLELNAAAVVFAHQHHRRPGCPVLLCGIRPAVRVALLR